MNLHQRSTNDLHQRSTNDMHQRPTNGPAAKVCSSWSLTSQLMMQCCGQQGEVVCLKKKKDSLVTCTLRGVGETAVGGHAGRFRVIFAAEFERDLRATEKLDTAAPRERP